VVFAFEKAVTILGNQIIKKVLKRLSYPKNVIQDFPKGMEFKEYSEGGIGF
jgi:hypothetical protein